MAATHPVPDPPGTGMRRVAQQAPIWVIAIMAHLALAAIFAITYIRIETPSREAAEFTMSERIESPKLEDGIVVEIPRELPPAEGAGGSTRHHDRFGNPNGCPLLDPRAAHEPPGRRVGGQSNAPGPRPATSRSRVSSAPVGSVRGGSASRGILGAANPRVVRLEQIAAKTKAPPVIRGGLRWLREHQSPDGSWDCDGFSCDCDPEARRRVHGPRRGGLRRRRHRPRAARVPRRRLRRRGPTPNDETVRNGLKYLRASRTPKGCFGPSERHPAHLLARVRDDRDVRGRASTSQIQWKKSAQAAIGYINACQNPYKAWRYGKRPGDNDASVTGWMLMALKAAKDAGLDGRASARCGTASRSSTRSPTRTPGGPGTSRRASCPSGPEASTGGAPRPSREALTAVAMTARIFCDAADSRLMKAGAELLAKKLPRLGRGRRARSTCTTGTTARSRCSRSAATTGSAGTRA